MPFDGHDYEIRIDAVDRLDRIIEQLASESRWCKGALYTSDWRRCIVGAMQAVDGGMLLKQPLLQAIEEVTGRRYLGIETFNDRRGTSHALVKIVLERARQNIQLGRASFQPGPPARLAWLKRLIGR